MSYFSKAISTHTKSAPNIHSHLLIIYVLSNVNVLPTKNDAVSYDITHFSAALDTHGQFQDFAVWIPRFAIEKNGRHFCGQWMIF